MERQPLDDALIELFFNFLESFVRGVAHLDRPAVPSASTLSIAEHLFKFVREFFHDTFVRREIS
jgi:hypothetical protein